MALSNKHLKIIFLLTVYYIFLYVFLLNFSINYDSYSIPKFNSWRLIAGFLYSITAFVFYANKEDDKSMVSSLFFLFQILLIYIPINVFIALHLEYSFLISLFVFISLLILLGFVKLCSILLKEIISRNLAKDLRVFLISPLLFWFSICLFVLVGLVYSNGISLDSVFDESKLYDFRSSVFNQYTTLQFITIYSAAYFFIPFGVIVAFENKWNKSLFILFVLTVILFSLTGMKTYLIIPVFTLFYFRLIRSKSRNYIFIASAVTIMFLCLISYSFGKYIDSDYPTALFLRSVMEPGQLHVLWIDFFYNKDKIPFWIFNPGSHPNFPGMKWEEIIAQRLGGSIGNGEGANTGFIANSYSVYGISGLIIFSFILSLILACLDKAYSNNSFGWITLAAIPSMFLLVNVSFEGVLIYFGLGYTLISVVSLLNLGNSALIKQKKA